MFFVAALSYSAGALAATSPLDYWICTGTALDDSSVFYWAMGKTRSEAFAKAKHKCDRNERRCDFSCEYHHR